MADIAEIRASIKVVREEGGPQAPWFGLACDLLTALDAATARAEAAETFEVACQEGAEIVGELKGRVAELEAALREATEWRPIDDEAKTGDTVLIARNDNDAVAVVAASWEPDYQPGFPWVTLDGINYQAEFATHYRKIGPLPGAPDVG